MTYAWARHACEKGDNGDILFVPLDTESNNCVKDFIIKLNIIPGNNLCTLNSSDI